MDRATTNFDDFWSQLDYTVMESVVVDRKRGDKMMHEHSAQLSKPSSPPTVVDLVPAGKPVDGDTPPTDLVKVEPANDTEKPVPEAEPDREAKEMELDDGLDLEGEDEDIVTDDENVSRVGMYSSAVTLPQNCLDLRQKRRRLRRMKQQLRESNAAKRLKRSSESIVGVGDDQQSEQEMKPELVPLPRAYLQRLAKVLGEKLKKEEEKDKSVCENLAPEDQQQQQQENKDEEQLQPPRANHQQHHRSNNNNNNINTVLNNNNSNSSSSVMNKDVSISEKINVIKQEAEECVGDGEEPSTSAAAAAARAAEAAAAAEAATATATATSAAIPGPSLEDMAKNIKRELIDADDSNEPLSSIRTAAVLQSATQTPVPDPELMDDEAEDDVNLAQLSSIIRHTAVKKELEAQQHQQQVEQEYRRRMEEEDSAACLNQVPDVIRQRNLRNSQVHARPKDLFIQAPIDDDLDMDYLGGLSPTSSQRLDICNELLSEIRRDWIHFRPKTPTDELSDSQDCDVAKSCDAHAVDWTQSTPINVEMNRLGKPGLDDTDSNSYFLSALFKYTDLDPDSQLLQTVQAQDYARGSSKSPNCSGSGSGSALEFNLSGGDSLNDINNLLGDDEDEGDNHEHMLDNILQECAMDDPKALNQATKFWNGILDGEAAVDEVEMADQLLDCIDEKPKVGGQDSSKRAGRNRKTRLAHGPLGSSAFTVCPTVDSLKERELFFSQAPPEVVTPKEEPPAEAGQTESVAAKEIPAPVAAAPTIVTVKMEPTVDKPQAEIVPVVAAPAPLQAQTIALPTTQLISIPAQITTQKPQPQVTQLLNQFANATPQIIARTEYGGGAAVGDIVTITPHTGSSPLPTLTAQQQLQHQLAQAQLRNVTVQQRQATPQTSNQNQNPQPQQQQQLLFQMQRDPSRTLTPLQATGAGATGNHMIYTTSSGEIVTAATAAAAAAAAAQKVTYAIQKTGVSGGGATTASIGPNTVITLSNVKVQNDDGSCGAGTNSGSSVNIINTASGQQLAVHSIAGMQQQAQVQQQLQQVQQVTTSTPLIVTTPTRNNVQQQQQQQQLQVQQQPIVWRQVSGTNTAVATTAVLSTSVDTSPAAVGSKIFWTNRATQKRQVNGPENTGELLDS